MAVPLHQSFWIFGCIYSHPLYCYDGAAATLLPWPFAHVFSGQIQCHAQQLTLLVDHMLLVVHQHKVIYFSICWDDIKVRCICSVCCCQNFNLLHSWLLCSLTGFRTEQIFGFSRVKIYIRGVNDVLCTLCVSFIHSFSGEISAVADARSPTSDNLLLFLACVASSLPSCWVIVLSSMVDLVNTVLNEAVALHISSYQFFSVLIGLCPLMVA